VFTYEAYGYTHSLVCSSLCANIYKSDDSVCTMMASIQYTLLLLVVLITPILEASSVDSNLTDVREQFLSGSGSLKKPMTNVPRYSLHKETDLNSHQTNNSELKDCPILFLLLILNTVSI
ncbi:unnamed protein product, partial [Meganyctiphanes norvegica]